MSTVDDLRRTVWDARWIPGSFGLRPHTVEVGLGSWSGSVTGEGTLTTTWTPIVEANGQSPKVKWLSTEEIAVGGLQKGSVRIGPITPDFSGGGTSVAQIMLDSMTTGQTRHVRITGPTHPTGAIYVLKNTDFGSALHYYITCEPVANAVAANIVGPTGDALMDGSNVLTDADGNPLIVVPQQLVDPDGNALTDGSSSITVE